MAHKSDSYLTLVKDECDRILSDRVVPPAIAELLMASSDQQPQFLFSGHPVSLATLPLAVFEAVGGGDAAEVAAVGAAMEFLLTAGDVLDDLQDGDTSFEGPEHHAGYVEQLELMTALLLLSEHAVLSISSSEIPASRQLRMARIFSEFKNRAFCGQYSDAHAQDSTYTSPQQILQRTQLKSGSLGKCAGLLGASLATDDELSTTLASEFGEHLGIVYQLKNDIFDVWPGAGDMDDARSGKSTGPTAFTLAVSDRVAGESAISRVLENLREDERDLEVARSEVFGSGGMHFAMIQTFAHLARTKTIASELSRRNQTPRLDAMMANL